MLLYGGFRVTRGKDAGSRWGMGDHGSLAVGPSTRRPAGTKAGCRRSQRIRRDNRAELLEPPEGDHSHAHRKGLDRRRFPGRHGRSPRGRPTSAEASTDPVTSAKDARALAARIDAVLAARWAEAKVRPAAVADDGEFLRRVSLDLIGKIPTAAEARDFLDDPSPDKRLDAGRAPARQPGLHRRGPPSSGASSCCPRPIPRTRPGRSRATSRPGSARRWPRRPATTGSSARSSPPSSTAGTPTRWPRPARAVSGGLLRGQGGQAREPRRRRGPRLPRHPPRMRPVPQPPVRQVEAGGVLGLRRLLRRGAAAGARRRGRRRDPRGRRRAAS